MFISKPTKTSTMHLLLWITKNKKKMKKQEATTCSIETRYRLQHFHIHADKRPQIISRSKHTFATQITHTKRNAREMFNISLVLFFFPLVIWMQRARKRESTAKKWTETRIYFYALLDLFNNVLLSALYAACCKGQGNTNFFFSFFALFLKWPNGLIECLLSFCWIFVQV